jgi:hypothetical protein
MFDIEIKTGSTYTPRFFTGPIIFKPVLFNPTRAQLNEFYGSNKEGELNYTSISENNTRQTMCSVFGYFFDKDGNKFKGSLPSIFIEDNTLSSTKTEVTKYQFIDAFGNTTWTDEVENIQSDYFFKDQCRKAMVNEDKLMNFFLKLAGQSTYYSVNSQYPPNKNYQEGKTFLDMEALLAGDFSKYQKLIDNLCNVEKTDYPANHPLRDRHVAVIASVSDDGVNCKQLYYNGRFISVKLDKNVLQCNDYDVKMCLKDVSPYDNNGNIKSYLWAHTAGELKPFLEEYTPMGASVQQPVAKEVVVPQEINTSLDDNPFSL